MSKVLITQLREERFAAFEAMKGINTKQEAENRALTGEESAEYDRYEARLGVIDADVARLERAEGIEKRFAGSGAPTADQIKGISADETRNFPKTWAEFAGKHAENRMITSPEYRNAWFHLMANGGTVNGLPQEFRALLEQGTREQRALSAVTGSAGGFTVPVETYSQIVKKLNFFSKIRELAYTFSTATGETINIPLENNIGSITWVAENTALGESDVSLTTTPLGAFKATRILKIPTELIQDSIVDIEGYIADCFGRSFGLGEGQAYVAGDGSGKPTGLLTQASAGKTVASAAALTADDIIDLIYSVSAPYRVNGTLMVSDGLAKVMRKLKNTQGTYLWQMSLQAGQPDVFAGKPVVEDPFLDTPGVTAKCAIFGDLSYFWIRDVAGITMQRLVELYAASGQIGMLTTHRSDSKLTNTDAVKTLVTTAA